MIPEANAARTATWTPLHDYASGKPQRLPLEILAKRYDINTQDTWGSTPAYIASKHNGVSALQELMKLGADLTIADKNGYLPLHIACYYGNNEIIKLLHERGVSLETKNAHKQDCIDLVFLARDEGKITVEVEKDILEFLNSKAHKEL
jgi:ankyrin repeat protein